MFLEIERTPKCCKASKTFICAQNITKFKTKISESSQTLLCIWTLIHLSSCIVISIIMHEIDTVEKSFLWNANNIGPKTLSWNKDISEESGYLFWQFALGYASDRQTQMKDHSCTYRHTVVWLLTAHDECYQCEDLNSISTLCLFHHKYFSLPLAWTR